MYSGIGICGAGAGASAAGGVASEPVVGAFFDSCGSADDALLSHLFTFMNDVSMQQRRCQAAPSGTWRSTRRGGTRSRTGSARRSSERLARLK